MTKEYRNYMYVLLALALVTVGCASGGAGDATAAADTAPAAPVAPPPDLDAVGANGLLTPQAIVGRFINAVGGEETLRSHTSMTVKGVFAISAMGMEGDLVLYAAAPDKAVTSIELGGMGSLSQGYNGQVGWSDNPMTGPALLDGDLLAQMKEQANFYGPLAYEEIYPEQETLELTEFNGESAYKVRMVNAGGREQFFFFSEESAFLIGQNGIQASDMGEAEVTVKLGDYADFGGQMTAKSTVIETQGMELSQTTTEIMWDSVPADAFVPPASIQALIE